MAVKGPSGGNRVGWADEAKAAAQALLVGVASAAYVATGDVQRAANTIASKYPSAHAREVEAEIARHLRNRG
jgi:hypothetical protein